MEKEKFIKMNKEEFKETIKTLVIFFIISIPFWFFYKTENEIWGLIIVMAICFINHNLSKKFTFLYVEPRLYLSLFVPLIMLYLKII